jgi:hypothetical protein
VVGAATGGFLVFEGTLFSTAVNGDASLRCFLEGGGERSERVGGLFSGVSSRARLRVGCLGVATDDLVGTGSALDKTIRNSGFGAIINVVHTTLHWVCACRVWTCKLTSQES